MALILGHSQCYALFLLVKPRLYPVMSGHHSAGKIVGKIVDKIVRRMVGKIVGKKVGKMVGKKVGKIVGKIVGKLVGKMVGRAVEDIQNWQLSAAAPPALRDNKLPFLLLQTTTFAQSYKGRNRPKRHMILTYPTLPI